MPSDLLSLLLMGVAWAELAVYLWVCFCWLVPAWLVGVVDAVFVMRVVLNVRGDWLEVTRWDVSVCRSMRLSTTDGEGCSFIICR